MSEASTRTGDEGVHGHHHRHRHGAGEHARAHEHAAHGAVTARSTRRLAVSLGIAAAIMVVEAVGGWWSGSLALLSDAGHMLTDVAALALALAAVVIGSRPADLRRTFGFRRLEVLAAQVNVATLFGLTGWIVWEAVDRLRTPHPPVSVPVMAGVAALGVLGNTIILVWLRGDQSLNTRSAFLHVLGDAVASLAVLAGALVIFLRPSLHWVDPALSLFIALLILWGAVQLMSEVMHILMEAVPKHLDLEAVCRSMEGCEGVVAVHDLHIWTISSGLYALSAHLVVQGEAVGRNDAILTEVKARLVRGYGIDHTTLQIESAAYAHVDDVHTH
jgi:cobalt-zinc-cadmium efflux system protein